MCGICGFINFKTNLVKNERENLAVAHRMAEKLRHRGPDSWGEWVGEHAVFAHSRLAVIDVENGLQPMKRTVEGHEFVITYNGELYNTNDIRNDLKSHCIRYGGAIVCLHTLRRKMCRNAERHICVCYLGFYATKNFRLS